MPSVPPRFFQCSQCFREMVPISLRTCTISDTASSVSSEETTSVTKMSCSCRGT